MILDCLSYQFIGQVETLEPDQIISAVYDYIWNVLHLCSGADCFSRLNCLLSNTGLSFNFRSDLYTQCFWWFAEGIRFFVPCNFNQWKVGYLCKDSKFVWFLLHPNPRLLQGTWLMGPWMEQLCICWKEWKAGRMWQNNRRNNLHVRVAKFQERKIIIIVGKSK